MKSEMTVADLFRHGEQLQKFIVPIYQRVFTWGDREVARLISDLHEHFVCGADEKKPVEDYYLGVITVVANKTGDLVLVDGQQRLTCLMLLGSWLGWDMDYDRLDYECRPNDKAAKERLKNGWKEELVTGNFAMDNFFKCANSLKDKDGNDIAQALKGYIKYSVNDVASHIKLLVSELPQDPYRDNMEEQNRYFEKMNAGGRQLEPHEILKVRICSQCEAAKQQGNFYIWNRATDFARVYKDADANTDEDRDGAIDDNDRIVAPKEQSEHGKTLQFLDCFDKSSFTTKGVPSEPTTGGEEHNVNRESVITLPMFLLHVLALTKGKDAKEQRNYLSRWREDRILEAFINFPKCADEADAFIAKMKDYRKFLDDDVIHLTYDKNPNVPTYTLGDKDGCDECEKLMQFQSMLFVANDGRRGKQEWLLKYYGNSADRSLNSLKLIDQDNAPWSERGIWQGKWEDYVDSLCYQNQDRWLFWRLDYLLWEKVVQTVEMKDAEGKDSVQVKFTFFQSETCTDSKCVWSGGFEKKDAMWLSLVKKYKFHLGRSIEHLHPQTDGLQDLTGWNEGVDNKESPTIRQKDRFWNLCLLTPSQNSTVGNDSVGVKFKRIEEMRSGLPSIKLLMMYMECCGKDFLWNCESAKSHLSRMKEVLRTSYLCNGNGVK